jgi:hypothetical protein
MYAIACDIVTFPLLTVPLSALSDGDPCCQFDTDIDRIGQQIILCTPDITGFVTSRPACYSKLLHFWRAITPGFATYLNQNKDLLKTASGGLIKPLDKPPASF